MVRVFKKKACDVCGKGYTPNSSRARWCSKSCKRAHEIQQQRKNIKTKVCDVCGHEFNWVRGRVKRCSPRCRKIAELERHREHNRNIERTVYHRDCDVCGRAFVARNPRKKRCCIKCASAHRAARKKTSTNYRHTVLSNEIVVCLVCGDQFTPKAINALVCSDYCRGIRVCERRKAYNETPERKAMNAAYSRTPKARACAKAYRDSHKDASKAYRQRPEVMAKSKQRGRLRNKTAEVIAYKRKWSQETAACDDFFTAIAMANAIQQETTACMKK